MREGMMGGRRIYGLDTWRAALLLMGPFVHAGREIVAVSHLQYDPFESIVRASGLFRMPAFFLIAGFLGAHAQTKQAEWLSRRLIQLAVPIASVLFLLLIPICLIEHRYLPLRILDPLHLWFLIDLCLFSYIFYQLDRFSWVSSGLSRIEPPALLIGFVLVSGLLAATHYPSEHLPVSKIVQIVAESPTYAIYYFAGFCLQRNPRFFSLLDRHWIGLGGLLFTVAAFFALERTQSYLAVPHAYRLLKLAMYGLSGCTGALIGFAIMQSAVGLTSRSHLAAVFSQASYTIYLLHLPVLMVISPFVLAAAPSLLTAYCLLVIASIAISLFLHETLVKRVPFFAFLFNGRLSHAANGTKGVGTSVRSN